MPGSVKYGKAEIKHWIEQQSDIKVIVDIGPGSGTYPKLLGDKYIYKAVEIWAPYVKQFNLEKYYEEIRIGDVRYIEFPDGDCVIFGDVLEHLPKKDAKEVIKLAQLNFRHVVISIPLDDIYGEEHYGNPYEKHLSTWRFSEIEILEDWDLKLKVEGIGVFAR